MIAVNGEDGNSDVQVGIFVVYRGKAKIRCHERLSEWLRIDKSLDVANALEASCFAIEWITQQFHLEIGNQVSINPPWRREIESLPEPAYLQAYTLSAWPSSDANKLSSAYSRERDLRLRG